MLYTTNKCDSGLQGRTYCYARVIQETCNTSAADINVLKTILYNVRFSRLVSLSCFLGELQRTSYFYRRTQIQHYALLIVIFLWTSEASEYLLSWWEAVNNKTTHNFCANKSRPWSHHTEAKCGVLSENSTHITMNDPLLYILDLYVRYFVLS